MRLERSGANRFSGWKKLFGKSPKQSWDAQNAQVVFDVLKVSDGMNVFDYRLSLDLQEIAHVIELVAASGVEKSAEEVAEAFAGSLRSFTRLSAVASGLTVATSSGSGSSKGIA